MVFDYYYFKIKKIKTTKIEKINVNIIIFWILYISFYFLVKYIFIFITKQTQHTCKYKFKISLHLQLYKHILLYFFLRCTNNFYY